MLLKERGHEIGLAVRGLKSREDELLFELLVVVLDEASDDASRAREHAEVERLTCFDAMRRFVVDEQNALERAVLLHEVLAGRHLRLTAGLSARLRMSCSSRAGRRAPNESEPAGARRHAQKLPSLTPWIRLRVLHDFLRLASWEWVDRDECSSPASSTTSS